MKKYLLITSLIFTVSAVSAQVRFGLKAGANASTAKVIATDGSRPAVDYGVGFHVGGELKVNIENQLFFSPQIQYAYKNFTINYNNLDTATNTLKMHYIEIPILFEWKKSMYKSGLFLQFGPSISVVLSGKQDITGKTGSAVSKPINYSFDAYGRAEANFVFNAGYQFGKNFQFTAGYAYGLGTIVDRDTFLFINPLIITASFHYFLN